MRRHLRRRLDAGGPGPPKLVDGLAGREVEQMERPRLVAGEREVAGDHHALPDGGVAAEAELRGDDALVDMAPAREGRLLAVDGDRPAGCGAVLERTANQPRRHDRASVVREACGAALGELDHLRQLGAVLRLGDRRQEADGNLRLALRLLRESAEDGGGIDDGLRVRHGEDGAVAACGRGPRSRGEVLLVLAPGRAQVHVRVDEGGRQHLAVRGAGRRLERRDRALLDSHGQRLVEAAGRIDDADVLEDERVLPPVFAKQHRHQATSSISATLTSTGPCVSRS